VPVTSHTPERLSGVDLARFVAVAGMVIVHARTDLVLLPLELSGGGDAPSSSSPWLEVWQVVATNRARLLFFLLAGVGAALLTKRRSTSIGMWWRRAAFLSVLGVALAVAGWSDLVLVFYGVLFLVVPLLVRLSDRGLVVVAVLLAAPAVALLSIDGARDDTATNVLRIVGEVFPLFCLGLLVGRTDLSQPRAVARLGLCGALLAAPGLALLVARGALDIDEVGSGLEPLAALTSTAGLCLLVLWCCLRVARAIPRVVGPFATAGSMPLTGYVGHALLFTWLSRNVELGLGRASLVAVLYLAGFVAFSVVWARSMGSGPVEAAMRRVGPSQRQADEPPPSET
jgi:uncharacterized protein